MEIVSFISAKGGVGKTTSAVNLSAILSTNNKVVLVDCDPQGSAYWWTSRQEQTFDTHTETDPTIIAKLRGLQNFDYIIVDSPPNPATVLLNAIFQVSDLIIVPTGPSPLDVTMAIRTARSLETDRPFRILLTRVDPRRVNEAAGLLQSFKKHNIPAFGNFIREYKAHEIAALTGIPITKVRWDYGDEAAGDYKQVARELRRLL